MSSAQNRRNQVMVGELPEDFLCVPTTAGPRDQVNADARVAQILQAQQQGGYVPMPSNIAGRMNITIVEAKLVKNYGLTKMDPYIRLRIGHSVVETPTAYNGSKNPRWNKEINVYIPHGVDFMYLEIYDERQFAEDNRIASASINFPEEILTGTLVDNWYPLSGKQGDGKEGTINLVMSFTAAENLPMQQYTYAQPVMPTMFYPPQPMGYTVPSQPVPAQPRGPMYTEEDLQQVKDVFPNMDMEAIKSVMEANRGNKDATINALLQMNSD